jgi:membrane-associated HD superfamily phosphohydrolase
MTHAWAINFGDIIYCALPGVMILVFAFYTYRPHDLRVDLLVLYLTLGISGFLLYFVVPACGPIYAFGSAFPFSLPPAQTAVLASRVFQSPPNAMPSLHFGSALMLYFNSMPWRRLRTFILIFVILTGVAVLAAGEHYVTDLVVAVPFVVILQSLFGAHPNKIIAALFSGVLLCFWFLVIVTVQVNGTPRPALWVLTAGSISCPVLLGRRLVRMRRVE